MTLATRRQGISQAHRRTRHIDVGNILAWCGLVGLLVFSVVPLLWMLSTSLKTQFAALQIPPQWIPENPTLTHYAVLLDPSNPYGAVFLRYFLNSFIVSLTTTMLGVLIAIPAGYAFSRFRFPGRNFLFFVLLVRNMFPTVVFLIPLFILMLTFRLVNTHGSLILTYLTFGLPLSIWLLKGFYDNVPEELERAARIDGASRFKAFWLIIMPLSSPGIIATAIYVFIIAWNEYVYAMTFLNSRSLLTMPVGLQQFFDEYGTNWPGLMASGFVMSVPVVVMFLVLQKYFVQALAEGAIKA